MLYHDVETVSAEDLKKLYSLVVELDALGENGSPEKATALVLEMQKIYCTATPESEELVEEDADMEEAA